MRWMVLILGLALLAGSCRSANCGDGFATVDGTCIPPGGNCGPCGVHEFCDATVVPNECRCAPGYEGDPCVFTSLIVDPQFLGLESPDTSQPYWFDEGSKGATVLPLAPGANEGDLGVGELNESVICNAGSLTQVVTMPSYEAAKELYVAEVTYTAQGVHGLAVGFDRAWKRLPPTGPDWATETFCIGEGVYGDEPGGSDRHVRISASERLADCTLGSAAGSIRVDRFTIRQAAAAECPQFGEVLNGLVRPGDEGWRFQTEDGIEGAIEPGEGSDGASGVRLLREAGIEGRATMTTTMSVPVPSEQMPSPALRFWWKGSSQQLFEVELGTLANFEEDDRGRQVATLVGSNSPLNRIYCLPPWTHGSVLDLSFSLTEGDPAEATSLAVDEVEIISDPDCGSDPDLLDPGFDSAPNPWFGSSLGSLAEQVSLVEHDGDGALELTYWTSEADLGMEIYVFVPQSEMDDGPAVTFFSKAPDPLSTSVQWVLGRSEVEAADVETTDKWLPNEACVPPQWAGRWFRFQVRVRPAASPGGPIDQERVFLDDFSLSTSAACPSN